MQTGALNYYAPLIFASLRLSKTTTALFAQGVYGIVNVVTCAIFMFFLVDTIGRRISLVWTGLVQTFCMFFIGFVCDADAGIFLVLTVGSTSDLVQTSKATLRLPPVLLH